MKIIPILKCKDIIESILSYTQVLDFEILYPDEAEFPYRLLIKEGARLDISTEDGVFGFINFHLPSASLSVSSNCKLTSCFSAYLCRGI